MQEGLYRRIIQKIKIQILALILKTNKKLQKIEMKRMLN